MAAKKRVFDPAKLMFARWQYEYTDTPNQVIADTLGCAKSTLHNMIKEHGWQPRLQRAARLAPVPAAAAAPATAAPLDAAAPADAAPYGEALAVFNEALEEEAAASRVPALRGAPCDFAGIAAKLGAMIEGEIGRLRMMQGAGGIAESERLARTAASLARTLRELQGVRAAPPASSVLATAADQYDDDLADIEDIDAFRNELANRIRAFVKSHEPQYADYDG